MPRPSRLGLVLLLLSPALAVAAEDKLTKKQVSASGLYTIYLRQAPDGSCRVIALKDGNPHWQLAQCLATLNDLLFISNDGERFWVVRTLAEKKKGRKKNPWAPSEVLVLYDREGNKLASRTAGALVPKLGIPKVRELGNHAKWLEGVMGVPGKPPRVTDQDELELEAVGPGYVKLPFDVKTKQGKVEQKEKK